jgi:hypothetical protein
MTQNNDKTREAFEAEWLQGQPDASIGRTGGLGYTLMSTHQAWKWWQAAWQHREAEIADLRAKLAKANEVVAEILPMHIVVGDVMQHENPGAKQVANSYAAWGCTKAYKFRGQAQRAIDAINQLAASDEPINGELTQRLESPDKGAIDGSSPSLPTTSSNNELKHKDVIKNQESLNTLVADAAMIERCRREAFKALAEAMRDDTTYDEAHEQDYNMCVEFFVPDFGEPDTLGKTVEAVLRAAGFEIKEGA